jgi:hypothetical protein
MPVVAEPADDLLRQQAELQAEARAVEADLQLDQLLPRLGEVNRVGSAALGLMVWRDIDLTVVCTKLALEPVTAVGARLAAHPRVNTITFRNDTEQWKTNPNYPDGLYLGVGYRAPTNNDWKLDIWFVDEPERQPDLAHMRWMPEKLTLEARTTILLIKSAWASRPEYGKSVKSVDIYSAVLKDGVRTLVAFDAWLGHRRASDSVFDWGFDAEQ